MDSTGVGLLSAEERERIKVISCKPLPATLNDIDPYT